MKTLKQIQEENRKFIIMANNPSAETHNEALEMELGFGCLVKRRQTGTITNYYDINTDDRSLFDSAFEVIGKPLTLDRVLIALNGNHYGYDKSEEYPLNLMIYVKPYHEWIDWDLTKETLEKQSEEVQRKFNEFISKIQSSFLKKE